MEYIKACELVMQQLAHENSIHKPYASTDEGIRFVTAAMLDLRQEAARPLAKFSLDRMTQTAIRLAALSLKFLEDLT